MTLRMNASVSVALSSDIDSVYVFGPSAICAPLVNSMVEVVAKVSLSVRKKRCALKQELPPILWTVSRVA